MAFLSAYAGRDAYLYQEALKTIRATLDNAHVTVARAQSRTLSPQSLDDLRRKRALASPRKTPGPGQRDAVFHPEFREDLRYWIETKRRMPYAYLLWRKRYDVIPSRGLGNQNRCSILEPACGRTG